MATDQNINLAQVARVTDIAKELQQMLKPMQSYEDVPLVSLEEAVIPLMPTLPEVQDYVFLAKERCAALPDDDLTRDQSASIILYTMKWEPQEECLYHALNAALRTEDRRTLNPWFAYLKLIITALMHLPSQRHYVYRGVKMDLSEQYPIGKSFVWWGFSSCVTKLEVLHNQNFLGKTGQRTIFTIDCQSGKDISRHSYYESENEVLIFPASQFKVISSLKVGSALRMIQIKEIDAEIRLSETVPTAILKGIKI